MTDTNHSLSTFKTNLNAEISLSTVKSTLLNVTPEYSEMINHVEEIMPSALATSENFYKSHSQYMNATIDITDLTPLHSIRHILARLENKKSAIAETQIGRKKSEIELRKKQKQLETVEDEFEKELLEVEIIEIMNGLVSGENYIKGAIREMSFLLTQYESILKSIGKDDLTEEDFEIDERRYHVMTAMKQALNSARPRGGIIDEGNCIYLFDIGINVAVAQREITNYLNMERELMNKGIEPNHKMTIAWLEACADLFQNCGIEYAQSRGFIPMDTKSLARPESIPLLNRSTEVDK